MKTLRLGPTFATVLFLAGVGHAQDATTEIYHDFRKPPLSGDLTLFNAEEGKFFTYEPEGLKIDLPRSWVHPWGGVGFRSFVKVKGDFEVTVTAEILQVETPKGGYGAGVCLYVARPEGGATLTRMRRPSGQEVLLWDSNLDGVYREGTRPCDDKLVRLRLQRTGTTMRYLWGPGRDGPFEEIHQCEFGSAEVERLRLAALTGRQPCELSVRLIDLRLRSSAPAPAAAALPPPAGRRTWPVVALAGAALVVGLGLTLHRRRRSRPNDECTTDAPLAG